MVVRLCVIGWLCLWWFLCVDVAFHVHARSTVSILSPPSVEQANIDHRPAVFGNPPYGSFRSAVLWYPQNPANQYGCHPLNLKVEVEPDFPDDPEGPVPIIMLNRSKKESAKDDRCSFVSKVRNAMAHAIAVVIINYDDDNMPYMADDGTKPMVTTPAILISHTEGNVLTAAMRPNNTTFTRITMQIGWQLPSVNGVVSWQLWTTAYDSGATSFKSMFGPADALLHMATSFEPKYYFLRGKDMPDPCVGSDQPSQCEYLCVKHGIYCLEDPDGDGWLTGADVVRENVWQMCLWKQLVNKAAGNDMGRHMIKNKWWSYVSMSESECDSSDEFENDACRLRVLDSVEGLSDKSQWYTPIKACYDDCLGGSPDDSCLMIEEAVKERLDKGIFYQLNTPTLVVNDEAVRGTVSCNRPLETRSCQALADICQGYNSTFRNSVTVCVAAPTGCDFGFPKDCGGQCKTSSGYINGYDACGSCLPVTDKAWNKSCIDCGGQVNGAKTIDQCGLCLLPLDPQRDESCKARTTGTTSSTNWGAVIAIVLAVAGVVGVAIYVYMKRQQNRMREDIDGILKQYLPLQDGNQGAGHIRPTERLSGNDNL